MKTWDEQPYNAPEGVKLTHAAVTFAYSGDLEGESTMHYLMVYRDDSAPTVIGLEGVSGRLGGKAGTFVLEYDGAYADGVASGTLEVVAGSGTGELEGLRGKGKAVAGKDGSTEFTLDYDLG